MGPDLERSEAFSLRPRLRWFRRRVGSPLAAGPEASVLAFASGKGGTGKSFLATNLAIALHRRGRNVVLVDCDFGLGNAHLLFGVNPRMSMQHLLGGVASVAEVITPTPHGPNLVAGGSGVSGLADFDEGRMQVLAKSLAALAATHDVLVLDCAAGLSPQSLVTTLAAHHLVLVTNPEIAALTDAYALIKCLARQPRMPVVHVVVNRVAEPGIGWPTFQRLADVAMRFVGSSIHYAGEIPEDPAVSHRRLGQAPLLVSHPQCNTAQAIANILTAIEGQIGTFGRLQPKDLGVEARILQTLHRR